MLLLSFIEYKNGWCNLMSRAKLFEVTLKNKAAWEHFVGNLC